MDTSSKPDYLVASQVLLSLSEQTKFLDLPRLVISDFDGTLFTPDLSIISEILYHTPRLRILLRKKHIPLVINTARSKWAAKSETEARLLGIYPDVIIVGAGTAIFYKKADRWHKDTQWQSFLEDSDFNYQGEKLKWNDPKVKKIIDQVVTRWNSRYNYKLSKKLDNPFQARYVLRGTNSLSFPEIARSLQVEFAHVAKIVYAESVYSNKFGFPTGEIIIIPLIAGKDNAVKYLLEKLSLHLARPFETFCFGDGTIDLQTFLSMPSTGNYILHQFLVHPTTLAYHLYRTASTITAPLLSARNGPEAIIHALQERLVLTQNNWLRKYISEPGKFLLDKAYSPGLSANEITLLGLSKVLNSVDVLYGKKFFPLSAYVQYSHGLFADIADGIRARQTFVTQEGQLADDFADRVREFYQLYVRAVKRTQKNSHDGLTTFKAGLSCILTGLARRQGELIGVYFDEGPTLGRTKQLFSSLIFDTTLNQPRISFNIDEKILKDTEETYLNRLKKTAEFDLEKVIKKEISENDKKTLTRWLLYVQLLQEENKLIIDALPPGLLEDYKKWLTSLSLDKYIDSVNVHKIRQHLDIKNYNFSLNNYEKFFSKWIT